MILHKTARTSALTENSYPTPTYKLQNHFSLCFRIKIINFRIKKSCEM